MFGPVLADTDREGEEVAIHAVAASEDVAEVKASDPLPLAEV